MKIIDYGAALLVLAVLVMFVGCGRTSQTMEIGDTSTVTATETVVVAPVVATPAPSAQPTTRDSIFDTPTQVAQPRNTSRTRTSGHGIARREISIEQVPRALKPTIQRIIGPSSLRRIIVTNEPNGKVYTLECCTSGDHPFFKRGRVSANGEFSGWEIVDHFD